MHGELKPEEPKDARRAEQERDLETLTYLQPFGREGRAPAPRHGRSLLICSPLPGDRFLLSEYAMQLGWDVALRSDATSTLKEIDPAVVLVVVRASDASTAAKVLWELRTARYTRDILYLAATSAAEECEQACARGATSATSHRRDLNLIEFFAGALEEARCPSTPRDCDSGRSSSISKKRRCG